MDDRMILDQEVVDSPFRILEEDSPVGHGLGTDDAVSLATWLEVMAGEEAPERLGVIVRGDDDPDALQGQLDRVSFAAIHFAATKDGRGYSHARRLRDLWAYQGDIVAFGDVLRDQLLPMSRCGINGFLMRSDQNLEASLEAFSRFSEFYQDTHTARP